MHLDINFGQGITVNLSLQNILFSFLNGYNKINVPMKIQSDFSSDIIKGWGRGLIGSVTGVVQHSTQQLKHK